MKFFGKAKKRADISEVRAAIRLDEHSPRLQILLLVFSALLLTVILELLNRRSLSRFGVFVFDHPLMFLLDYFLVFLTLSISQLFHRRIATHISIAIIWLVLGVTNFVVILFRTQPFSLADVMLIKDMFSLLTVYFTWYAIIGIFAGLIGVVVLCILLFKLAPRREHVPYLYTCIALVILGVLAMGCVKLGINSGYIKERFTTLKDAYQDYGYAYTFLKTFADLGISKPDDYSSDAVDSIIDDIESTPVPKTYDTVVPNILFIQLESFFDAEIFSDEIVLSENPTPNYHNLLTTWPSGDLYVPVVGGGTANTEFEMLSGMNLDFFGAGEYPYYTVLRDTPCETICYVLNRLGYTSTAVHNYMATFYGRNEVYSRLGFNVFESMEFMDDLEYGEIGWAKDERLTESVKDAMRATSGRDFVMGITVSTHGKYPADYLLESAKSGIQVLDSGEYIDAVQLQNFVNLAKGMDDFLGSFLEEMSDFDEPVICVFYGDHLPALDWDSSCLDSGNMFATEYCIWTNYGARFDAPDTEAYRVAANLLLQLGIEDGVIFRYHQSAKIDDVSEDYLEQLQMLEYDMLYGDLEVFKGELPFEPTEIRMGIDKVTISSVTYEYGRLMVHGDNFNEFSTILMDDEVMPTAYIDKNTVVAVLEELPEDAESLCVAQISNEQIELSRTEALPVSAIE